MSKYLDKNLVMEWVENHYCNRSPKTHTCVLESFKNELEYGLFNVEPPTPNEIELFPNRPLFEDGYSLKYYHSMVSDWHTDAIMYLKRRVEALEGRG